MRQALAAFVLLAFALASCGTTDNEDVTVMAASSLRVVSEQLTDTYEEQTGTKVRFNLAGSQALAAQVLGGAASDLLLVANRIALDDAGQRTGMPQRLAANDLVILVPTGNPEAIEDLSSLVGRDLVVVVADPSVPVGAYTQAALDALNISLNPASLEASVSGVATRVATGDADAGLGYATDAAASPSLDAVQLGSNLRVEAEYFAATIDDSSKGEEFLEWLLTGDGADILVEAGFVS